MNNPKDPSLKLKYAAGVGDLVAWFLHSKLIGWLTKLITGKDKPCQMCSKRAQALNVLFPIPFWRLFFGTYNNMINSYKKDLEEYGYNVKLSPDGERLSAIRAEVVPSRKQELEDKYKVVSFPEFLTTQGNKDKLENYTLVKNFDTESAPFLIRTQIFKLNS